MSRAENRNVATTVEFSFDTTRLDIELIHRFLSQEAYWSPGIPRERVETAIANSLCIGAYADDGVDATQIGFARVVTDRATFACLSDVFVVRTARGAGVAARMVRALLAHPTLDGLRRVLLFTADAHRLYAGLGFAPLAKPERGMEILAANPYGA